MNYSVQKIGQILHALTQVEGTVVTGISFDSRNVQPGDLFVALVAENDGHHYIAQALQHGAAAVLVDDQHQIDTNIPAVIVPDTLIALQNLGQYRRNTINPKVIAITGSNGKTTTKDMTSAIMSSQYKTFKTPANFNNEIGVPMTLLSMPDNTEVLVIELGMDRPGQLTLLSQLVRPDIAIITMIGEAHIEFFKTRENIAKAKLEIIAGLKKDGILLIPESEPLLTNAHIEGKVQTFGENVTSIVSEISETKFTYLHTRFAIPLLGRYNIMNALAAISAGILLHIELENAVEALRHFDLTKNRTEKLTTSHGVNLISDVYNSNPTAVAAVLATLKIIPATHKYVVLGDMLELGEQAASLHACLAQTVIDANVDSVYLVGPLMKKYLYPILQQRFDSAHLHQYETDQLAELIKDLQTLGENGDVILLKASHGIHLENVVNALVK
ncbi:UDP-N-acetylmuramoyl-tripeptide--D-alanyl-D-alanine ligase [Leuconostoc litchii]|uniref:UDP-N-acetylmuramoyl-tripeptide--D-alanyl-D-alanine ligase n=1 Tax=Leuconostoc litchii TaxID=1981069 RepID=A0A6P2CQR7_9LACO|nr:UDP-N-acetylmuramoyl-tripeptide--D-alanyl-D-alanine ligase [Leuconostoc litchii]TYC47462.1 UDP-N-acetylmuramoyl-tripeptide--D-alanyl-D-alanine ligase [Leuconostoc litchii]GMA69481.1 UDP-N-acetylmuramoyl-tripeptide--D-alanyl-D-alanine ligase [Leuconostoc litchii]